MKTHMMDATPLASLPAETAGEGLTASDRDPRFEDRGARGIEAACARQRLRAAVLTQARTTRNGILARTRG